MKGGGCSGWWQTFLVLSVVLLGALGASSGSKHLHALRGIKMEFGDKGNSDVRKRSDGTTVVQPFPSQLHLEFEAFEKTFAYDLNLVPELVGDSVVTVHGANDEVIEASPFEARGYHGFKKDEDGETIGWISVSVHDSGVFHALVMEEGEFFVIDPISRHESSIDSTTKRDLSSLSNLVIYKDNEMPSEGLSCGAMVAPPVPTSAAPGVMQEETPVSRIGRHLSTVSRWTECYPNDSLIHQFNVGFYATYGFYSAFGNANQTRQAIFDIVTDSNIIYLTQLNVFLAPGTVVIKTAANSDTFNEKAPCSLTISQSLDAFLPWARAQPASNNGAYHLLNACYTSGVVGLAYIGTICNNQYNVGTSSLLAQTWKTFAHELGHNFGASHTFQDGQGTTGGIMDYGDGTLNGEYQFNTKYSKNEVCSTISQSFTLSGSSVVQNCWKVLATNQCGNGIVEDGEDCDDSSSCCQNCKFAPNATCSGGECCKNCQYALPTTSCGSATKGFCSNGKCLNTWCGTFSNLGFCNIAPATPCQQTCTYNGGTTCYMWSQFGYSGATVPDGTVCSTAPYSFCSGGACLQSTANNNWVVGSWSSCPASVTCGPVSQTRTVACKYNNQTLIPDSQCKGPKPATSQDCGLPPCQAAQCPAEVAGSASWPATSALATVTGTCQAGYTGAPNRTCSSSGTWSAITGACTKIQCPSETAGNAVFNQTAALTNVTGVCTAGYVGSPTRVCQADGTWGPVSSPCTAVVTGCPEKLIGSAVFPAAQPNTYSAGICQPGYAGNPMRQCKADSTWNTNVMYPCARSSCPKVTEGNVTWPNTGAQLTATVTCPSGKKASRVCSNTGTWQTITNPC